MLHTVDLLRQQWAAVCDFNLERVQLTEGATKGAQAINMILESAIKALRLFSPSASLAQVELTTVNMPSLSRPFVLRVNVSVF